MRLCGCAVVRAVVPVAAVALWRCGVVALWFAYSSGRTCSARGPIARRSEGSRSEGAPKGALARKPHSSEFRGFGAGWGEGRLLLDARVAAVEAAVRGIGQRLGARRRAGRVLSGRGALARPSSGSSGMRGRSGSGVTSSGRFESVIMSSFWIVDGAAGRDSVLGDLGDGLAGLHGRELAGDVGLADDAHEAGAPRSRAGGVPAGPA